MTATAAPFGLQPTRMLDGGAIPAPQEFYNLMASGYNANIGTNSPVTLQSDGTIAVSTTAQDILGVFAGCQYMAPGAFLLTTSPFWPAAGTYQTGTLVVWLYTDPQIVYWIQANGSLAQTSIGDQADFVNPGTVNTTTGISSAAISSTLATVGVQAQLRILNLAKQQDNAWGDAFPIVEVQIARQQYTANKVAI